MQGHVQINRGRWVYIVRTDDTVLYVGQATEPRRRLLQHFTPQGCVAWHGGQLTELARDNWDDAQSWEVELRPVEGDLDAAEAALIHELRPALNRTHNDNASVVPEGLLAAKRDRDAARIAKIGLRREVI